MDPSQRSELPSERRIDCTEGTERFSRTAKCRITLMQRDVIKMLLDNDIPDPFAELTAFEQLTEYFGSLDVGEAQISDPFVFSPAAGTRTLSDNHRQNYRQRSNSSTRSWLRKIFTERTPAACITNTRVFSHAQITFVLVAQAQSTNCSVIFVRMKRVCHLVSHLPHLTSSPPQHEAPPGQHDLLQDDTVHRAHLPEPIQSTSSANEPLSHVNYESGGNPRNTSLTGCEAKELATKRACDNF